MYAFRGCPRSAESLPTIAGMRTKPLSARQSPGIVDLDPQITDSAFQFRVPQQELNRPKVFSALVERVAQRFPGLISNFELNQSLGLALQDDGAASDLAIMGHVLHP